MWILKPRVIHQSVLGGQPAGSGQLSSPLKLRPGAGFPPPAAHLCPEKPSASLRTNVMGTWGACCTLTFNPCEDPWVAGDRLNRLPNPGTLGSPRQRAQDPHSESLYPRRAHHGARTRASWAARLEFKFWIQSGAPETRDDSRAQQLRLPCPFRLRDTTPAAAPAAPREWLRGRLHGIQLPALSGNGQILPLTQSLTPVLPLPFPFSPDLGDAWWQGAHGKGLCSGCALKVEVQDLEPQWVLERVVQKMMLWHLV